MFVPQAGRNLLTELLFGGQRRKPTSAIPVTRPERPAPSGPGSLHITWYGHASVLADIEGHRVLFDPVWSRRCSRFQLVGPKRLHDPPVAIVQFDDPRRGHAPPLQIVVVGDHDGIQTGGSGCSSLVSG